MTIAEEFKSRNFSIYGQWLALLAGFFDELSIGYSLEYVESQPKTGVLCIILCFALGIANIFTFHLILIAFAILCIISGFVLIFIEVPLLLRICPTSSTFDAFIRRFTTNYMRAAVYGTMSLIQWLSLIKDGSSLIAAAVFLLLAAFFYTLAGLKGQGFVGSKTLGGQGVAQMIV